MTPEILNLKGHFYMMLVKIDVHINHRKLSFSLVNLSKLCFLKVS